MRICRNLLLVSLLSASLGLVASPAASAQEDHPRGRKYKAPPDTAHIDVEVVRSSNSKPVANAAVVFNVESEDGGKDEGNLEIKTGPDGKAAIDVIPVGSKIRVQVIADGFATYAEEYTIAGDKKEISIKLLRPRAQVSTYVDNTGKPADRKPGVQEPVRPKPATPPATSTPPASASTTDSSAPAAKPNL